MSQNKLCPSFLLGRDLNWVNRKSSVYFCGVRFSRSMDSRISKSMIHGEPSFGGFQMNRHGLRDDQFTRIERLLPGRPGYVGRDSELGNRLFVEAVIWKFRTGVPWRDPRTYWRISFRRLAGKGS